MVHDVLRGKMVGTIAVYRSRSCRQGLVLLSARGSEMCGIHDLSTDLRHTVASMRIFAALQGFRARLPEICLEIWQNVLWIAQPSCFSHIGDIARALFQQFANK